MFTWDWVCKHAVFLLSGLHRKTGFTGRQAAPPEHFAQFVHMAHSFTPRAYCTICSHGAQLHHQSSVHNLFTVACSAQPQGVLSPVG